MRWDYQLVESVFVFTGTQTFICYAGPVVIQSPSSVGEAEDFAAAQGSVRLGQRGDAGGGAQTLELSDRRDLDVALGLTDDNRLTSLTFKSTGVGARVVAAGAKLLGTVIGLGARAALPGRTWTASPTAEKLREHAEAAWQKQEKEGLVKRRAECAALVDHLLGAQLAQWKLAVDADGAGVDALTRSRRISYLLAEVRSEIERMDARKAARLAGWLPTRTESVTFELSTAHAYRGDGPLPAEGPDGPPELRRHRSRAQDVWDTLGLAVQIGPPDTSAEVEPVDLEIARPATGEEEPHVRWRVPRRVQVRIWRRAASGPVLESSDQQWIVDEHSDTRTLALRERLFGSSSATITFGPLGAPSLVTTGSTSAAGALADALGAVPADLAAGLASATSLTSGVTGLLDARAERQLAGVKRRVELQQQQLELLGSAAAEDDYVRLKVLQQRVQIADAEGKLLPPDELALTTREVELLSQRRELEKLLHPDA